MEARTLPTELPGLGFLVLPLSSRRYVFWCVEAPQWYPASRRLENGLFNWTMTPRRDSDVALPYGTAVRARPHPREGTGELRRHIGRFGRRNRHLAARRCCGSSSSSSSSSSNSSSNSSNSNSSHVVRAAWFVSHCDTASGREQVVKGRKSSHKLTAKLFSETFLCT